MIERRIIGSCLCRRYASGGMAAMLDKRPITERERQKTMANPPQKKHWAALCVEKEHADSFEARVAEILND